MKPGVTGLTRIINAAGYSWQGFQAAFKYEAAFRQELFLCLVLTPIALVFGETGLEKAILIGCLFIILIAEILNSAIEALVDRFDGDINEYFGRAKDMGSAAVFLAFMNLGICWFLILFI